MKPSKLSTKQIEDVIDLTTKKVPTVVIFPPQISVSDSSNKYQLVLDVKWGQERKQVVISREETLNFNFLLTKGINEALLDLSELKPYTLQ